MVRGSQINICPFKIDRHRLSAQGLVALVESIRTPSSLSAKEREDKAYQVAVLIHHKSGKAAPKNSSPIWRI